MFSVLTLLPRYLEFIAQRQHEGTVAHVADILLGDIRQAKHVAGVQREVSPFVGNAHGDAQVERVHRFLDTTVDLYSHKTTHGRISYCSHAFILGISECRHLRL